MVNLNAVNGLYTYNFDDKEKVNKYEIEIIHRSNPKIEGDIGGNFKLTILIETITPIITTKINVIRTKKHWLWKINKWIY